MPMPAQSDLHINAPLTNVSVAYIQRATDFIAGKVFPKVKVSKQSDLFWKYSKSDWRRTDVKRRAPATESPGVGWSTTTDNYFCHAYAVHKDIDDQIRANADSNFRLDKESTEFITNQLLIKRDLDWNASFFKPGVWDRDVVGGVDFDKFDDVASDPIGFIAGEVIAFRKSTGMKPNKLVLGANVMRALKQHPDIIDRIKYTQRGIVTEDLLATLFDVDNLYTSYASFAEGPQIADAVLQDANATYEFMTDPNGMLMLYAPDSPSLQTPSAGYTFTWDGYIPSGGNGIRVKRFREERIESDRIEASMTYDMKVVSPDCGVYFGDVVDPIPE